MYFWIGRECSLEERCLLEKQNEGESFSEMVYLLDVRLHIELIW